MKILDEHLIPDQTQSSNIEERFSVFKRFNQRSDLEVMLELFRKNDIPYKARENTSALDTIIIGNQLTPRYWIEIYNTDFKRANAIIEQAVKESFKPEDLEEHFMNSLSSGELEEALLKPDEWNPEAIIVAKALLEKRGVEVNEVLIQNKVETRLKDIKKTKKGNPIWMIIYLMIGVIGGFFMGFLGLIVGVSMGAYYSFLKSTAPDGERYYEFDSSTRKLGYVLMIVPVVMLLLRFLILVV